MEKKAEWGNYGLAIASFIIGIFNLCAWVLPICGVPLGVIGIVLGYVGMNSSRRTLAIVGITLCGIGFFLALINGLIGAYRGMTGQLF